MFRRVLLACTCVAGLLAGFGPQALAASSTFSDPKHDAVYNPWPEDDYTDGSWGLDIRNLHVTYDRDRLTTRLNFYSLQQYAWSDVEVLLDTDGDGGVEYRLERDTDDGLAGVYRGKTGIRKVCDISFKASAAKDFIAMSAPSSCFGKPHSVRTKADIWWTYDECDPFDCTNSAWDDLPEYGRGWLPAVRKG